MYPSEVDMLQVVPSDAQLAGVRRCGAVARSKRPGARRVPEQALFKGAVPRACSLCADAQYVYIYRASHPRGSRNETVRAAAILSRLQPSTAWVRILDEARVNSKESNVKRNEQRVNECRVKSKA